jgi:hypothetical protein
MKIAPLFAILPCVALLPACSSEGSSGEPETSERWDSLMSEDWTLEPSSEEKDRCIKVRLEEDIHVSAIRPIAPPGTHHTFVALSDTADLPGCTLPVGQGGLIYASGAGTKELRLPEGVAIKLPAGKFLNFSLHLFNPSRDTLSGTSGLEIVRMRPEHVRYQSGATLAGPLQMSIPPGRITLKHQCQLMKAQTAYALFPHMHQLGTHFKATVTVDGASKVIHDADYDFNEQRQLLIEPLAFQPGDTIQTECTFENSTPHVVTFGESSTDEMCISFFFAYPLEANTLCGPANPAESIP